MAENQEINTNEVVYLCTGEQTEKAFFDDIQDRVWSRFSRLECGTTYTVETLIGAEYYAALTDEQQGLASLCVATLVMDKMMPLAFTVTRDNYRLTAPFAHVDDEEGVRRLTEIYYQDMPMATSTDDPEAVRAVIETFSAKLR